MKRIVNSHYIMRMIICTYDNYCTSRYSQYTLNIRVAANADCWYRYFLHVVTRSLEFVH